MKYVLMVMIIAHTVNGANSTQTRGEFDDYQSCATAGVAEVDSQQQLYPDAVVRWECEPTRRDDAPLGVPFKDDPRVE